ncbi:ABC transporter substrate-binding protein [Paenibacillus sp. BC26]|uniref:ABC transporter substrate-binding protein n=1 Tax=Paenibacillus sp. BC26 TaxID=1881032 RepID=UPI0008EA9790|nr:ABC transporter substrate-binding protein [Paenibacillus sp. BC26]SFT04643.1 iron complex transport system substrate-binding protein [Paenibacillus sp. BC26]
MNSRMKRGALYCVLIIALMMLASCGKSAGNNSNQGANSNQAVSDEAASEETTEAAAEETTSEETTESEESQATRIYKDADGKEVEIPANPQRIVVLEYLGEALAVGAKPIGTAGYLIDAFAGKVDGIQDVGDVPVNLEKITAMNPDLIVSFDGGSDREDRPQLEKVAPFVSIAWNGTLYEHLRAMGDIVGKKDQAEQWIKDYEAKAQSAKEQISSVVPAGSTAVALGIFDKSFYAYEDRNIGHTLYHALGFTPTPKIKEMMEDGEASGAKEISLEVLPEYAKADYLFVMLYGDEKTVNQKYEDLKKMKMWTNIPAVKAGHVYVVGPEWFYYDALTLEWELDETVKMLTAKPE